jgi:predicted RNase H-like HicB family nuclease
MCHFDVVIERDEDGYYLASIRQIHGCYTQAQSLDELMGWVRNAAELCLALEWSWEACKPDFT